MKNILLPLLILVSVNAFCQRHITGYIEIKGKVDYFGDINLEPVMKPVEMTKVDSLIDYKSIFNSFKYKTPIGVLNKLSALGWELISVTQISIYQEESLGRPFILYYLKHDYIIPE